MIEVPAGRDAGHDSVLSVRCVYPLAAEDPQKFWVISGSGTRDLAEQVAFIFRRPEKLADQLPLGLRRGKRLKPPE